jgi:hypothetical protein
LKWTVNNLQVCWKWSLTPAQSTATGRGCLLIGSGPLGRESRIKPKEGVMMDVFITQTALDLDPINNYTNEFYRNEQVKELMENTSLD